MKKIARILSIALASLFCLAAFTACSGKNYAANNTEYFIGATGPLTGSTAVYGLAVQHGAQMAVEEINAAGGLNGVKFKFDMKDDVSGAEEAATGYTALYEAGMQLSIGSVTSGSCKSFADRAKEDGVLFITPSASAADVIAVSDLAFRVCFGDPQQGTISANELTKTYKKIGVIYDTSDPYSYGIFEAFEAEMTKLGKAKDTDYVVRTFDQDSNKDFSTQVANIADAGCDVIYLPIYYTEAGLIAKAAADRGFNVPVFGNDGLDGIAGQITEADKVSAHITYTTPFDVASTDEKTAAFVKTYTEKFGEAPNQFAADGYDAVYILFNAMKAAGIDDVTMSAADISAKLKDVLTSSSFSYSGLTGSNMTWSADGSCNKEALIVAVQ